MADYHARIAAMEARIDAVEAWVLSIRKGRRLERAFTVLIWMNRVISAAILFLVGVGVAWRDPLLVLAIDVLLFIVLRVTQRGFFRHRAALRRILAELAARDV